MQTRKVDSTDDVRFLMKAYVLSEALNTALEFGLFWQLADEPQDAAGVAETLGIPANRAGTSWLRRRVNRKKGRRSKRSMEHSVSRAGPALARLDLE